jgi:uncharacterized protein YaaN involved in tellurite resistance
MGIDILENTPMNTSLVKHEDIPEAKPPKGISEKERQQIETMAEQVVNSLTKLNGAQATDYGEQFTNIGFKAQQTASTKLNLFQTRMGKISKCKEEVANQITNDVISLKNSMRSINPAAIKKEWLVSFLEAMPFGNNLLNALQKMNTRKEKVEEVIATIESSLTNGRNMIVQDTAELKVQFKTLETAQLVIQKNAYLAEKIAEELDRVIADTTDVDKQNFYKNMLFRTLNRGQDLRAVEAAYEQSFAIIKAYRETSALEIDNIQRMLTVGMNVITTSFAIHVALEHQRQVIEATKATKAFIGGMLIQNATAIRENTKNVAELYKEPIISIQDIEKAQGILMQAIDEIDNLKTASIQAARENIVRLKEISAEMRQKGEGNAGTILSLEAGDYKELPVGESK